MITERTQTTTAKSERPNTRAAGYEYAALRVLVRQSLSGSSRGQLVVSVGHRKFKDLLSINALLLKELDLK